MTTLLHDRELRERLVTQARDRVRTCYSAEARARRIFDLYDTLVG
jgi:glycosyltransferase involved in cell wall biosynthesis